MNSIVQFLSPSRPKSLFASALLKGEIPPDETKSKTDGDKRKKSDLDSPESSPEEKAPPKKDKKEKISGIPVGSGAMPGQK